MTKLQKLRIKTRIKLIVLKINKKANHPNIYIEYLSKKIEKYRNKMLQTNFNLICTLCSMNTLRDKKKRIKTSRNLVFL